MILDLDDLHTGAIRRAAAQHHSFLGYAVEVVVVELVTVPVAFGDLPTAVEFDREGVVQQDTRICAQTHRPAFSRRFSDLHQVNHGMRRGSIELRGIRAGKAADIAGKFNDRHLHPETDAKERDLVFTSVTDRFDFAFAAAIAESTGNQNTVSPAEDFLRARFFDLFRFDPVELDPRFVVDAAVNRASNKLLYELLEHSCISRQRRSLTRALRAAQDLENPRVHFSQIGAPVSDAKLATICHPTFLTEYDRHFVDDSTSFAVITDSFSRCKTWRSLP